MATRTNYVPNPSFEGTSNAAGMTSWTEFNKSASVFSYQDTSNKQSALASLRIDNGTTVADFGRKSNPITLPAGTYTASAFAQVLAGTTNAAFVIRRVSDLNVYIEQHWTTVSGSWIRRNQTFTLATATTVEILLGVGSYGARSAGSARFDSVMIEGGSNLGAYFDGSFTDTPEVNYSWTGTANNSTSTAVDAVASGGNDDPDPILGWELVESSDFSSSTHLNRFIRYNGFAGTNGDGFYSSACWQVVGGILEGTANGDTIPGIISPSRGLVQQKVDVWAKWNAQPGYKPVIFSWSDRNVWADGELDLEMTDSTGNTFEYFFHDVTGSPAINRVFGRVNQNIKNAFVKFTLEVYRDRVIAKVNDVIFRETTDVRCIPVMPWHLVIQMDVGVPNGHNHVAVRPGYPANPADPSKISIDRIDIYKPSTTPTPEEPPPSTLPTMIQAVYTGMKYRYLGPDGRVKQREDDDKVVSEGQPYMMMVAVQLNDQATFDLVESFNTNVLERKNWTPGTNDAWRVGTANDPRVLAPTLMMWNYSNASNAVIDANFATDADKDRMTALYWAWKKWGQVKYYNKAEAIRRELEKFGYNVNPNTGIAYPVTDEYQQQGPITATGRQPGHHTFAGGAEFEQNLSYNSPLAIHQAIEFGDNDAFWTNALVGEYDSLEKATDNAGDASLNTTAGLPPDWNTYSFVTDDAAALTSGQRGWTNTRSIAHRYDAFRTTPRARWGADFYGDAEAKAYLTALKPLYQALWTANGKIAAELNHDGTVLQSYESTCFSANAVYVLTLDDPTNATAAAIKAAKLNPSQLYGTDSNGYKFWATFPGGTGATGGDGKPNWKYFQDFWTMFYFLREAGLWQNFGQGTAPTGGVDLAAVEPAWTTQDTASMTVNISLAANEELVSAAPGSDSEYGAAIWGESFWPGSLGQDEAFLTVERILEAIEATSPDLDTADMSVPGQPGGPSTDPPVITVRVARWIWVSRTKNKELELTHWVDGIQLMRNISGLYGAPPVRVERRKVSGLAGAVTTYKVHDVKKIQVPLVLSRGGVESLLTLFNQMVDLMDPVTNDGYLRYVAKDGHISELDCEVISGLEGDNFGSLGPTAQDLNLVIEAPNPYWQREPVRLRFNAPKPRRWFPFPPLRLGSSAVIGEVEIQNNSQVPAFPQWTISGIGGNPILSNNVSGFLRELAFDVVLGEDDLIEIDTRPRGETALTVLGPNKENWFGKLQPGKRNLWALEPGLNKVNIGMVAAGAGAYVALTYRPATLTP